MNFGIENCWNLVRNVRGVGKNVSSHFCERLVVVLRLEALVSFGCCVFQCCVLALCFRKQVIATQSDVR